MRKVVFFSAKAFGLATDRKKNDTFSSRAFFDQNLIETGTVE